MRSVQATATGELARDLVTVEPRVRLSLPREPDDLESGTFGRGSFSWRRSPCDDSPDISAHFCYNAAAGYCGPRQFEVPHAPDAGC